MSAPSVSLEAAVAKHDARLDAQHDRLDSQDAAIVRIENKLDSQKTLLITVLVATLGTVITGLFNLLRHV